MRQINRTVGLLAFVFLLSGARTPVTSVASVTSVAPGAAVESRGARPALTSPSVAPDTGRAALDDEIADALSALGPRVRVSSHPDALATAFRAYFAYRAAHPERVRKPYLYYVDYGLGNGAARGWVFDMDALEVVDGPFNVAHGRGSSRGRNGVPMTFSNRPGSATTSLGLYLTQETYGFSGTSGGRHYRSVGLRLAGLSGDFNDAARRRGIVAHGAPYVTGRDAGRSEGCPAMEQHRARLLLPLIAEGSLAFLYSPNHDAWLDGDPWLDS